MTKNTFSSHNGRPAKRHKVDRTPIKEGSNEEVLLADIRNLLAAQSINALPTGKVDNAAGIPLFAEPGPLPERFTEVQVKISALSSTGDGLGVLSSSDHVYVVPFTAAGDTVTAKVITHFPKQSYSLTDFVRVVEPSPRRDDSRIKCPYFAKCSGCQFQMLSYEDQLAHKKTIIEKAYRNFSGLIPEYIPSVENTLGSPLQYGYRTKLTPHFDGPPGSRNRKDRRNGAERKGFEDVPSIGFMVKGTRRTLDIEDCPIGTEAVRMGMKRERQRVAEELGKYKRGATLLLRESTGRIPKTIDDEHGKSSHDRRKDAKRERHGPGTSNGLLGGEPPVVQATEHEASFRSNDYGDYIEEKTCITDSNATSTEYVDNFIFSNKAGAFFQNNNSILSKFTAYIRDHILPPSHDSKEKPIRYLIDAYSGSGLFTITLSSLFSSSTGIDIAEASITSARLNARANNIPERNATFIAADAAALFKEITYPPDETVVVIDPPRKGCDNAFLSQLLCFAPRRVVYVSCNVHTQARDVGVLITGNSDAEYRLESLRGFDFFPQTGHVEGVAVLNRHRGVRVTIGGVEGEGETG
ncbi:tRNA(m5U54)methyltransferase [Acarospora aff. strigata]|nr:tRNA(m5U54)methyltransferase [Acarospora aff. strigata]